MCMKTRAQKGKALSTQPSHAEKAIRPIPEPAVALQRAQALPASHLSPGYILALQRTIGNRAVQHWLASQAASQPAPAHSPRPVIQPKLMVGPANDHYEQEADRMAEQVAAAQPSDGSPPAIQRKCDEDEPAQRKSLASSITPLVQRQAEADEDEQEVQTKRGGAGGGFQASGEFESRLEASRGQGSRLPERLRSDFEQSFGADFHNVRVHTDSQAHQLNVSLSAKAFTRGNHIYLAQGAYDPNSKSGRQLLAHELTHVVQQGSAAIKPTAARPKMNDGQSSANVVQRSAAPAPDQEVAPAAIAAPLPPDMVPPEAVPPAVRAAWCTRAGAAIASGARSAASAVSSFFGWAGSGLKSLGSSASNAFRGSHWQGSTPAQQTQIVSARAGQGSGVSSLGGTVSSLIGADNRPLAPDLRQADAAYRHVSNPSLSQAGLGFGAAGGILSGAGGVVDLGSGVKNVFGGEKVGSGRWFRRGFGRVASGGGQAFAGAATSARAIAAMTNATTGAAKFLSAAAVPAQIAMGGVDMIKGGWGVWKTLKSQQMLSQKREDLLKVAKVTEDYDLFKKNMSLVEFAKFADEYQGKRQKRKAVNMISGALGVVGGAMMMTGVGLIPGLAVAGAGGVLKAGAGLYGAGRDKIMDLGGRLKNWWRGTDNELYSQRKKARESEMAEVASQLLGDEKTGGDAAEMLKAIGMDEKTVEGLRSMTPEERKPFILAQIMRR